MTEQEIIDRLVAVFKNKRAFTVGKVTNIAGNTCTVKPTNGDEELIGVRLSFVETPNHLFTPAEGSVVVVGFNRINKMQTQRFIVYCNNYTSYRMLADGYTEQFSLTKTEKLITELNKTNAVVNAIKSALLNFIPVPGDGGAALKTLAGTAIGTLSVGDFSGIKNEKFKHG